MKNYKVKFKNKNAAAFPHSLFASLTSAISALQNPMKRAAVLVSYLREAFFSSASSEKKGSLREAAAFGFTLIEVIIYLAIFSMIAVTLLSLAYFSSVEDQKTTNDVINAYENNI
jgi:type II secretory pathway pseudopilin PulG